MKLTDPQRRLLARCADSTFPAKGARLWTRDTMLVALDLETIGLVDYPRATHGQTSQIAYLTKAGRAALCPADQ